MNLRYKVLFVFVLLFASSVCAEDIAYVVKDTSRLNHDFLNSIGDLNLTVKVIDDDNINLYNLSNYRMVLVGNDRFSEPLTIPVNDYPTLISNQYYMDTWYWVTGISLTSSNQPLSAKNVYVNQITRGLTTPFQVYDSCCQNGQSLPMYYLAKEKRSLSIKAITSTMADSNDAVVALSKKGTQLKSGQVSKAKGIFFGITESYQWTQNSENLFKNSIMWLVNEPPKLNSNIPNVAFDEDTQLVGAYDLSQYFSDKENDVITFSMTGGNKVKVNFTGSVVTLYADANWFGSEQVKFVATEEDQSTESNVVTITVRAVNDAPALAALPDVTFVEGDYVKINATATDVDGDTVGITYSSPLDPSQGSWQTGLVDAGTYTITVDATDYRGGADSETFTLTILPKVYVNEFSLEGWVELYNPHTSDLTLDSWTLSSAGNQVTVNSVIPANGFLVVNLSLSNNNQILLKKGSYVIDSVAYGTFNDGNTADNALSPLVPKSAARRLDGYDSGSDKNDFIILDLHTKGLSNTADVTPPAVSLVSPDDGFVLTASSRQASATFSVSDNKASDLDCELFMNTEGTFESLANMTVRSGNRGTFTLSDLQDGSFIWNVRCYDGRNYAFASNNRTLVVAVNDPPVITSFSPENLNPEVSENSSLSFTHDSSDPENGTLAYSWKVNSVEKATTKDFVYSPGFFDSGNKVVKLVVKDDGNLTATQEWNVKVINVNRKPYLNLTIPEQNFDEDKMYSLRLSDYFADYDNEGLSYKVVSDDTTKVDCSIGLSKLYMEPASDFNGNASCVVAATDGIDDSDSVTVFMLVNPFNDAPRMRDDIVVQPWDEGTNKTGAFNLNDYFYDVDSSILTYNVTGNSNITVTILDTGNVTFSQPEDWYGTEYVRFTASDGNLTKQSDSVRLNVRNINDVPQALPIPDVVLDEDTQKSIDNITIYFFDKDENRLTYKLVDEDVSKVDCILSGQNLTIKPAVNFFGNATCSITASDSDSTSEPNVVNIIVDGINDAPVFNGTISAQTWNEDSSLNDTFDLDDYFDDADNDPLNYTFVGNSNINITISPDNKVSLSQPADWFGSENVTFIASDGNYSVSSNVVVLTVTDANEPPVMDAIPDKEILEDSTFNEVPPLMASDSDGTIESFAVSVEDVTKVDCDVSGNTLKLIPAKDYVGEASCTITVTDNSGGTDSKAININVKHVNDPPEINSSSPPSDPLIAEDGSQAFSVSYKDDADPDYPTISVKWYVGNESVGSGDTFNYVASGKGVFDIKVEVSDGNYTVSKTWSLTATDCPITKKFDGSTTKFCELTQEQLANASCVVLERVGYGKVDFCGSTLDLSNVITLDDSIYIGPGFVVVNTNKLPALTTKAAKVTMYDVHADGTPKIYYNSGFTLDPNAVNVECPSTVCSNIDYTDNVLSFDVAHFSAFKTTGSTMSNDPQVQQTCSALNGFVCSSDETCSGSWLSASDTSRCCSVACTSSSNNNDDGNQTFENLDVCEAGVVGDLDITIDEPDDGDDFKPGEKISVEVKVKNKGDDDLNVELEAVLFDKDDDDELDSDSDDVDVDSDDSEDMTFELEVPDDVDEDNDIILFVKAFEGGDEDKNCAEDRIDVDVKRQSHDVLIDEYKLSPSALSCDNTLTISFTADNVGKSDESLYFTVTQLGLGVDFKSDLFDVDEDDELFRSINIEIPQNSTKGVYPFELNLYFDDGKLADSVILDLNVLDCISNGVSADGVPRIGPSLTGSARLDLLKPGFDVESGASITIPVKVTNNGLKKAMFSVTASGISSYATVLEAPKLALYPGESSTAYVYVKTLPDSSGKQSASVDLMVGEEIVDSKALSISIGNGTEASKVGFSFRPAGMGTGTMVLLFITALIVIFVVFALVWATYKPKRH